MDPGARLRAAREARKLDLVAVAERTHIPLGVLRALEEGRYAELPPPVYVRSFVQQYAAAVDVPADELVAAVAEAAERAAPRQQSPALPAVGREAERGLGLRSLATGLVLAALVTGIAALYARHSPEADMPPPVVLVVAPSPTALPALAVIGSSTISSLPVPSPTTPPTEARAGPSPTAPPPGQAVAPAEPTAAAVHTAQPPATTVPSTAVPTKAPPATPAPMPAPPAPKAAPIAATVGVAGRTVASAGGLDASKTYAVRRGDTLYRIADRLGISAAELARANGLDNPNRIRSGQVLQVP